MMLRMGFLFIKFHAFFLTSSRNEAQRNDRMIFVSSTLRGAFGKAWRLAVGQTKKTPRKKRRWRRSRLLEDFAERPIFSVGDLVEVLIFVWGVKVGMV